jgi:chorismate mutase
MRTGEDGGADAGGRDGDKGEGGGGMRTGKDGNAGGGVKTGSGSLEELEALRAEIEGIDRELIRLMAHRVALARSAGVLKRMLGMPALDPAREAAVVRHAGALAREAGVSDEDVRYIFWHIIGLARRAQMEEE